MTARDMWLEEGLAVLAEQGPSGVRIDRIAARLQLTKGSFHHHFEGISGYKAALLERYQDEALSALQHALAELEPLGEKKALVALPEYLEEAFDIGLETAVRSWAFQDDPARMVQERVDSARLAAIEKLWLSLVRDAGRARTAALVPHLLAIGSSVALPPLTSSQLREVFDLLGELIPAVVAPDPDPSIG